MKLLIEGTGGPDGRPEPGCGCAFCRSMRAAGQHRAPDGLVVGGRWRPGERPPPPGYALRAFPGGCLITGPDGARLLCTAGAVPGDLPRCDVVLADVLSDPYRLGLLRRRTVIDAATLVAAPGLGHWVSSPAELARRLRLWGVADLDDGTVLDTAALPRVPGLETGRTLVLGGSGSGKSAEAELRLAAEGDVTYAATGPDGGNDPAWRERIAAHRARRPRWWTTVETADPVALLGGTGGAVLVDSIGTWLTAVIDACGAWDGGPDELAAVASRTAALVAAWRQTTRRVVAVSEETGSGVVPATGAGRLFRDLLGRLNQRLAAESDRALLVVAGRVVELPA